MERIVKLDSNGNIKIINMNIKFMHQKMIIDSADNIFFSVINETVGQTSHDLLYVIQSGQIKTGEKFFK